MMQENQRVVEEMKLAVEDAKKATRKANSGGRRSSVTFSDNLLTEAEALKSSNSKETTQKTGGLGLNMNDIRGAPGLRQSVEDIMEREVYTHSSLAHTPSALSVQQGSQDDTAAVIAALRVQLAEKQRSLEGLLRPAQTNNSKEERRAARKLATEKAAAEVKAAQKAAAEKLLTARADIKLAKRAAKKLGLMGISTSSDSGSDTDDELDMDQTLTKKKKLVKKTSKLTNTCEDSEDSSDDEGPTDVLTDRKGRAFRIVDGKLELLPTYVKDPSSGKLLRTTPSSTRPSSPDSSDDRAARKKEKKSKQRAKRQADASGAATQVHGIAPLLNRAQPAPPVPSLQENRGKSSDTKEKWSAVD